MKLGADPATARAERRSVITVEELADRFLADHVSVKRKTTTGALYTDVLKRILAPRFGKTKVDALSRADLANLHADLASTPFQANRMLAIVGSMYSFGSKLGLIPEGVNPARGIDRYPERGRERFLSRAELERLVAAIDLAEAEGIAWDVDASAPGAKHLPTHSEDRRTRITPHAAAALRLLILTGARLREILHLRWSEVDLERRVLFLSDSKTGRKTILLNDQAVAILTGLERSGEYVIAGDAMNKPRSDLKRPWAAVAKAAGLHDVRLHDLRHTYASLLAAEGYGLAIIGKLLGHSNIKTTSRYAHLADDPLRKASNAVGNTIMQQPVPNIPPAANDDAPTPAHNARG